MGSSNEAIIYQGRYIRRLVGPGWGDECYIVVWEEEALEDKLVRIDSQIWNGTLEKLKAQIDYDDEFFGEYRWLI